jgi:chromosome segregation ATPase
MDITKILGDIKGKVLDAANFDLLKHAYELQENNIEQLKSNNEALKESNEQYIEKLYILEQEIKKLQKLITDYELRLEKLELNELEISEIADAILNLYLKTDETVLNLKKYYGVMPYTKIEIESGIGELSKKKILLPWRSIGNYGLTDIGKKYLAGRK